MNWEFGAERTMLQIMGIVAAIAVIAVLVIAALKSNTFRIARSTRIGAPAEKVYPFIADFHRWTAWSPWENLDPALKRSYSGADQGIGAVYAWEGNNKVGAGRMEITEATASSRVALNLDFLRPFRASNTVVFTLEPDADGTLVTWNMQGHLPYMAKVMHTLMNVDKMVGKDFEKGLAGLKSASEST
jgi:hypothetical protein